MDDMPGAPPRPDGLAAVPALLAVEASLSAVATSDLDGRLTYVNPAFLKMWGFATREAVVGRMVTEFWRDPAQPHRVIETLMTVGSATGELEGLRSDGRAFLAEASVMLVRGDDGQAVGMLGWFNDVTARRRAEAIEHESRMLYADLVASVPVGVYRVRADQDGTFCFVYANDRYCHTLGLTRDAIMAGNRATVDIIHPDDREAFERVNREAVARQERFVWEGRILVNRDTRWIHVDSHPTATDGHTSAWTGFVMDITDRHAADAALRSSEYFLSRSQEVTRIGSFDFDIIGGLWVCTATLDDIFGLEHGNPKRFDQWVDLLAPDDRDAMVQYFVDRVLGRGERFDREYRIIRGTDGQERWVFGLGELEFDPSGRPVRMIGTIQDITERKRAEQDRLDLERRLLHAQKLESLGVLAGGIAHDFNNLLLAVIGNLDLALADISPASAARTSLEQSMAAARRAADLTRQMLAYSGKAAFDVRPLDLNEVVEENAHLLRACIPKLVHLDLRLGEPRHAVVADAGQMQQVIMNLITNAAEAIGDVPGAITLTTQVIEVDAVTLEASRIDERPGPGPFVCLEVRDTGCGMDRPTQERLFDPFFTTKRLGRGLGMSAILGIVRGHRGAIMVESEPDRGTTIRVLLPAGPALGRTTGAPADDQPTPVPAVEGHVLVVDDEDMVRRVCRRMLEHAGWAVLDAADGPAAIGIFTARADEISCVVLDLSMPQMDGFAVLGALKAIRPDVKVILSSGYSRTPDPETDPSAAGFAGFIQKPYAVRALRDEVSRVIGTRLPG